MSIVSSFKVIPMGDNLLINQDVGTPLGRHGGAKSRNDGRFGAFERSGP